MIKINNLSKSYGRNQVLNSINLEFEKSKIYGIVGENGAGKTTLFRCISGLENYQGNISSSFTSLKEHVGLLLAEPFFFSKITGREYIRLLANARHINLTDIKEKNIFNLPLDQYASTYSTGMKKKLALTAVLLQQNSVFFLDEPFNGVDIQSNLVLTEIFIRLKSLGKIVVISSHIFSTLAQICDEIHVMKNGEIIKKVDRVDFDKLEKEMKEVSVGNQIDKLKLK